MSCFRSIRIDRSENSYDARYVDMDERDLMPGDVDLDVTHSAINYKDGLAVTGKGAVVRRFPMIPGVDLAGRVTRSNHPDFAAGDVVVGDGLRDRGIPLRRICSKGPALERVAGEAA